MSRTCNCCKYLERPCYEESYTICGVFGEEVPEEYETEDGCNCSDAFLAKQILLNEQAWIDNAMAFVKWHEEQEKRETK